MRWRSRLKRCCRSWIGIETDQTGIAIKLFRTTLTESCQRPPTSFSWSRARCAWTQSGIAASWTLSDILSNGTVMKRCGHVFCLACVQLLFETSYPVHVRSASLERTDPAGTMPALQDTNQRHDRAGGVCLIVSQSTGDSRFDRQHRQGGSKDDPRRGDFSSVGHDLDREQEACIPETCGEAV